LYASFDLNEITPAVTLYDPRLEDSQRYAHEDHLTLADALNCGSRHCDCCPRRAVLDPCSRELIRTKMPLGILYFGTGGNGACARIYLCGDPGNFTFDGCIAAATGGDEDLLTEGDPGCVSFRNVA
jgi:hypothetical protein